MNYNLSNQRFNICRCYARMGLFPFYISPFHARPSQHFLYVFVAPTLTSHPLTHFHPVVIIILSTRSNHHHCHHHRFTPAFPCNARVGRLIWRRWSRYTPTLLSISILSLINKFKLNFHAHSYILINILLAPSSECASDYALSSSSRMGGSDMKVIRRCRRRWVFCHLAVHCDLRKRLSASFCRNRLLTTLV